MRDADDDLGFGKGGAFVHLADEMLDHFFGHIEVGNHAFAHRADRFDAAGRATQHQLGVFADGEDFFLTVLDVVSDHRGLGQDNTAPFDVDKRIRCPKVDGHVRREHAQQFVESQHLRFAPSQ